MTLIDKPLARFVADSFDKNRNGRLDDDLDFGVPMGVIPVETIARGLEENKLSMHGDRLAVAGVAMPADLKAAVKLKALARDLSRLTAAAAPLAHPADVEGLLRDVTGAIARHQASTHGFGLGWVRRKQGEALATRRDAFKAALAATDMPEVRARLQQAVKSFYALAHAAGRASTPAEKQDDELRRRSLANEIGVLTAALGELPEMARRLRADVPRPEAWSRA